MFGQGISLAHPEYRERFSHDIDLVVANPASGNKLVGILNDLGFATTDVRSGSYRDVPFHDWTLDAPNIDGHRMHVDVSAGAITRADGWMKPVVLPNLFDAAQVVALPSAQDTSVLVPSDTHQLLLLVEKVQRTQRYDYRVRCDVNVLVRLGNLDTDFVAVAARHSALSNSLRWAVGGRLLSAPRRRNLRDRVNSLLIAAMARTAHGVPRTHGLAAKAFRRICI
ncbi:hypothetical protein [Amycolatopsis sp. NBC_00438]|uniref:hypothetical protein n=1 Tax=Amycolatopsis sp. NBC_00438 TaxID=2903558 RepID=UPI002E1F06E8